jgi:hypothetical protein
MLLTVLRSATHMLLAASLLATGCYRSYARRAGEDASVDSAPDFSIDPGTDEFEECHDRIFDVSRGRPDVLILMDRSTSMSDGGYWTPARLAVEDIVTRWGYQIAFGFAVFPSRLCMSGSSFLCTPTTSIDVETTPDSAAAIEDALVGACCCGGTPIAESLDFVGRYYRGLDDGHAHHLLLVTDGAPNCNPDLDRFTCTCTYTTDLCADALNCLDDLRTVAAASDLWADDVPVHVLGIAEAAERWSWVMDAIAGAGGTGEAVLAEERERIAEAMDGIAGDVAPCRFELAPGEIRDPDAVYFLVDGVAVPHDPTHTDGWDFVNAWTVDFYGPACDRIVAGEVSVVTARVNCDAP